MLGIEGVSVIAGTLPLRLNGEAQQIVRYPIPRICP
jgi:hypothetical protein